MQVNGQNIKHFIRLAPAVIAAASVCAMDADAGAEKYRRAAEFTVSAEVVNENVRPFTATGADARGLPPGAMLLYVFEGISD